MWKTVHDSVAGTSHVTTATPCQDSHRVATLSINGREALVGICSDGAGSAKHADKGSAFVCDRLIDILSRELCSQDALQFLGRENVIAWCRELRVGLSALAQETGCTLRDLAATMLGAIIFEDSCVFFQIGDGAIVVQYEGLYEVVFWPQSGEYANTTNFVSDETSDERLEFSIRKGVTVSALAMFTDGLERLILKFSDRIVHVPFLEPLFASLESSDSVEELFEPLRKFLSSERVNERTDDDKTLVLAMRVPSVGGGNAAC